MSFLETIKKDIQHYFVTRGVAREHETGHFNDLTAPVNLALFFCIDTKGELDQIRTLVSQIKKQHIRVSALVFTPGYGTIDLITDDAIMLFNLNDFTLFGKKKEHLQQHFDRFRFELLISFIFDDSPFSFKLMSEISASFKIGPWIAGRESLYDMTLIYQPDLFGIIGFYEQVLHYLSVLRITKPLLEEQVPA